ncbi:MAG: hypothetical protein IJC62_05650 [Clostridia bacterium]|nr:hypothetical protein [Clostridia bacterium]
MKRLFAALMLIMMLITLTFTSCGKGDGAPDGMKLASGEAADYVFYVPEKWTVDLTTKATAAYHSADDPSNVSVTAWDLEYANSTVEDWWAVEREDLDLVFENVEIVTEANTTIDGSAAKKIEYTGVLSEMEYKIMQVAVVRDSVVYVLTYTSVPESYDLHLDEVALMLEYLEIK